MNWLLFASGLLLGGGVTAAYAWRRTRRALARVRRLTERARTREHLVDLAKMTGGLAHEIKNPLSTVKVNLQLLAEDFEGGDSDLHRRNLNRLKSLQDEVQRLHDILDDFLKFVGNQEMHASRQDLRRIVRELVDFFRPQAEANRVVLRAQIPDSPVWCRLDAGQIKQALLNLVINATQAMSGHGGDLLLRLHAEKDRAVLEVIDTGPGMEPQVRDHVFDAYFTTRIGGSGLGLPTARRIVRQHDGELSVESEVGKGTRFMLVLPLTAGVAGASDSEPQP